MNDVAGFCRAYNGNEITNIAWIRPEQNIAGSFTRLKWNKILFETMQTDKLKFVIEQWICKNDDTVEISRSKKESE